MTEKTKNGLWHYQYASISNGYEENRTLSFIITLQVIEVTVLNCISHILKGCGVFNTVGTNINENV